MRKTKKRQVNGNMIKTRKRKRWQRREREGEREKRSESHSGAIVFDEMLG